MILRQFPPPCLRARFFKICEVLFGFGILIRLITAVPAQGPGRPCCSACQPIKKHHARQVVTQGHTNSGALTEHGSLNPALCGQAAGATRNSVKCPIWHDFEVGIGIEKIHVFTAFEDALHTLREPLLMSPGNRSSPTNCCHGFKFFI